MSSPDTVAQAGQVPPPAAAPAAPPPAAAAAAAAAAAPPAASEAPSPAAASYHKQASKLRVNVQAPVEGFDAAFSRLARPSGGLPLAALPALAAALQLPAEQLGHVLSHVQGPRRELSRDDAAVLCQLCAAQPLRHQPSLPGSSSIGELKRGLSRQRAEYLGTGQLATDEAVVAYTQRLDEHRRMCELTGRYAEAGAAAARIAELKTAQGERLRGELLALQHGELAHLMETFEQEARDFDEDYRQRVLSFEAAAGGQLAALVAAHDATRAALALECESRRPLRPQHSGEYLNSRRVEEMLVKQGQYRKAHDVKLAADALYDQELAATQAAWDAEVQLRRSKLEAKQQGEVDVLLARTARGRDELELRRQDEAAKRHNRLHCMAQELESMHRLELAHLEAFLEGQQLAGKAAYVPLRSSDGTFRRRRELLLGGPQ